MVPNGIKKRSELVADPSKTYQDYDLTGGPPPLAPGRKIKKQSALPLAASRSYQEAGKRRFLPLLATPPR
jgi:hypothetical protein